MKLMFVGSETQRIITSSDFPEIEDDFRPVVWGPGDIREVSDKVGEHLLQYARHEFQEITDTRQPEETKEQLMERASKLQIVGRTKMNKDELQEAIVAAESGNDHSSSNP